MFVIRLPNGNLKVPQSAIGRDGRVLGDVYVEIGPQDADYARLAEQALSPEEAERRRDGPVLRGLSLRREREELLARRVAARVDRAVRAHGERRPRGGRPHEVALRVEADEVRHAHEHG